MAEVLRVEIDDVTRDNPLLDEAMGMPSSAKPAGGASSAPGGPPLGGPNFPATVMGPDGKQYTTDAYFAAQRKFQSQKDSAEAKSAGDAFFGPPKLPWEKEGFDSRKASQEAKFPEWVYIDGEFYTWDAVMAAKGRKKSENQKKDANDAYKKLYGDDEKGSGGGSFMEELLGNLGFGKHLQSFQKMAKAFGGGGKGDGGEGGSGAPGAAEEAGAAEAGGASALGGAVAAGGIAVAVMLAVNIATKSLQGMKQAIDAVTYGLEGLAQNDLSAVDEGMLSLGKGVANAIPVFGELMSAELDLVHTLATIPDKLDKAFIDRAHQLGPYSGQISVAEVQAEIRGIRADMREANELGPDMARLIDAQSRLDTTMRDILLPIKKVIVDQLASRLELLADAANVVSNLPSIIKEIAKDLGEAMADAMEGEFKKARADVAKIPNEIDKILDDQNKDKDFFDQFIKDLHLPPGVRPGF